MVVNAAVDARSRRRWIPVALSPLVWMVQGAAGWYLTGRACPAAARPIPLGTARALIVLITLAALACTVGAVVSAGRSLRTLRAPADGETTSIRRRSNVRAFWQRLDYWWE